MSFPPGGSSTYGNDTEISTWHRTEHDRETRLMAQKVPSLKELNIQRGRQNCHTREIDQ